MRYSVKDQESWSVVLHSDLPRPDRSTSGTDDNLVLGAPAGKLSQHNKIPCELSAIGSKEKKCLTQKVSKGTVSDEK